MTAPPARTLGLIRSPRSSRPRATRAAGFSLIEILVVLALIALLGSMLVVNITSMTGGLGPRPLPEILKRAVRDARFEAASRKEVVTLHFAAELGAFVVRDAAGQAVRERETGLGPGARGVAVRFEQILPQQGTSGWNLRDRREEINALRFAPDRSSTPFVAIVEADGRSSEHRFDPFSNLEVVDAED